MSARIGGDPSSATPSGQACPISGVLTDQNAARTTAAIVLLACLAVLLLDAPWLLGLLVLDFGIRGFISARFSPFAKAACAAVRVLRLRPNLVDLSPKRFAARIGTALAIAAAACWMLAPAPLGIALTSTLAACAFLEAVFGFCVGCRLYALLPPRIARVVAQ